MEDIISPIEKKLLEKELISNKLQRKTNKGNNLIYIISAHNSPNVMLEIGRLREISFRGAGGGTGKAVDIDEFDTCTDAYQQLIVWNPRDKEIVGGYRFINCKDIIFQPDGKPHLATSELFDFSKEFLKNYLPVTIELGRSFVQPLYQPLTNMRRGMYSLDNLWDGLGALIIDYPGIKYFFGKITMYPHFNIKARDMILFFIEKYFFDTQLLISPIVPVLRQTSLAELESIFIGKNYNADYKILNKAVRNCNENIPPLVNAYMNLSSTMRMFGTAINEGFGAVEETGILITIDDIYPAKKERHLMTYK
ncbi:MAG: GNAT family N-acetyltransferase [Lentimicrobiaceae bacterium]|nr:GNAT family N-acetyltransferase [Lentimicrobiaceae bacterium]